MRILALLLFPLLLIAESIEVHLATASPLRSIYLTRLHDEAARVDWRYVDELRIALEFDLNQGGWLSALPVNDAWEQSFQWHDLRPQCSLSLWQQEKIPFVCALQVSATTLSATLFQIEEKSSKRYPDLPLTGRIEEDRRQMHALADLIHKDLFGVEGIASLKILYAQRIRSSVQEEWSSNIWVADADGINARQLTKEQGYCLSPGFLSKKNQFYYVTHRNGQSKICTATFSKAHGDVLISLRGEQHLPAFTAAGHQMAFISDAAGRPDLFIQNLGPDAQPVGKARQLFSAPRATQASPTYSPNGRKIAFVSDKDGAARIYLLDVTGPQETKAPRPVLLTKANRENTSPAWSPDGTKLAYSAKVDGVRQIWLYDFATEEEIALTTGAEDKENPAWAPDSLHLLYNTESQESCELFLINIRNPEPLQISKGLGQKRFPAWEPAQ